jgi:hypothetical protein
MGGWDIMELKDLLDKPVSECTEEELEKRAHILSKLKLASTTGGSTKRKSNKEPRAEDLLKNLNRAQVIKLLAELKEKGAI